MFETKNEAIEFANNFSVQIKKRTLPGQAGSVLSGALKKQWNRESTGTAIDALADGKRKWKKIQVMPKKQVNAAKIEATLEEFQTIEALKAKLAACEKEVDDAKTQHEERLAEKSADLKINIKYYGSRVQILIQEIVSRTPYDQESGMMNSLALTIKKLGIDSDQIKFSFSTEDFTDF